MDTRLMAQICLQQAQRTTVTAANRDAVTFRCNACSEEVEAESDDSLTALTALMEHVAFAHAVRADLLVTRTNLLLSAYEIAESLGLSPATAAEEKWRLARL